MKILKMYISLILSSLVALSLANSPQQQQQETIIVAPVPIAPVPIFPLPVNPICGPNEVLSDCVTPCEPSCEFPNQLPCPEFSARSNLGPSSTPPTIVIVRPLPLLPPPLPPSPCSQGCVCANGFVRNDFGRCIERSQCAPICKPNSHFEVCGPRCQPTCDVAVPRTLSVCAASADVCVTGCFCNSGYVKDLITGQCVIPKDCSHVCPDNEHYSDFGTTCVATCDNPVIDWAKCVNFTVSLPGCYCNQGYLRDLTTNKCVRQPDCPPKSCPKNEQWYRCKPCTETCPLPKPLPPRCVQCETGCDCSAGFVRNTQTNQCVQLCECPQVHH